MPKQASLTKTSPSPSKSTSPNTGDATTTLPSSTKSRAEADAVIEDTDALLDEIDKVLDENVIKSMEEQAALFSPMEEKPLSLGDLMREGAQLAPQAFGSWETQTGATCALGGIHAAMRKRGLA